MANARGFIPQPVARRASKKGRLCEGGSPSCVRRDGWRLGAGGDSGERNRQLPSLAVRGARLWVPVAPRSQPTSTAAGCAGAGGARPPALGLRDITARAVSRPAAGRQQWPPPPRDAGHACRPVYERINTISRHILCRNLRRAVYRPAIDAPLTYRGRDDDEEARPGGGGCARHGRAVGVLWARGGEAAAAVCPALGLWWEVFWRESFSRTQQTDKRQGRESNRSNRGRHLKNRCDSRRRSHSGTRHVGGPPC